MAAANKRKIQNERIKTIQFKAKLKDTKRCRMHLQMFKVTFYIFVFYIALTYSLCRSPLEVLIEKELKLDFVPNIIDSQLPILTTYNQIFNALVAKIKNYWHLLGANALLSHIQSTYNASIALEFEAIQGLFCEANDDNTSVANGLVFVVSEYAANEYSWILKKPSAWTNFEIVTCIKYLSLPFKKQGRIHTADVIMKYIMTKDYEGSDLFGSEIGNEIYCCPPLTELHDRVKANLNRIFTNLYFYNMHFAST